MGAFEDYPQELQELIDAGDDRVIAIVREMGRGKGSGIDIERSTVGVWTLRDGRAIPIQFFDTKEDALRSAGRS